MPRTVIAAMMAATIAAGGCAGVRSESADAGSTMRFRPIQVKDDSTDRVGSGTTIRFAGGLRDLYPEDRLPLGSTLRFAGPAIRSTVPAEEAVASHPAERTGSLQ